MNRKIENIDGWVLHNKLGRGANAVVWKATRNNEQVALKVLKNTDSNSEPYKRFQQEVSALKELVDDPGVMPLLDSSLPSKPCSPKPAWLAMPEAIQSDKYFKSDSTLSDIVTFVHNISQALSRCADKNIFHRDIKPANLFSLRGKAVVGDFGLVHHPNREALTKQGRKLGPAFFLPDEFLNNAASAKPGPADVFMLAKTLWVLAAGQNLPPQGEIQTRYKQSRLSGYWDEPNAYLLDELIERCTNAIPDNRPTMKEFSKELSAYLVYDKKRDLSAPDLKGIGVRLKPLIINHRNYLTRGINIKAECDRLLLDIKEQLLPMSRQIVSQTDLLVDITNGNYVNSVASHPEKYKIATYGPSVNIVAKVESGRVLCGFFVCGIGLMVSENLPTVSLIGANAIYGIKEPTLIWYNQIDIIPNSAHEKEAIAELIEGLNQSLHGALNDYAEHLANTEPTD